MDRKEFKEGWYILYTKSRSEKQVENRLQRVGLNAYLPLHKELRQWSDRKKWVEKPLFNSYVFVYLENDRDYLTCLQDKGAAWFVTFEGDAAVLRDKDVELIKRLLNEDIPVETLPEFTPGQKTTVQFGPLSGTEVEIVKYQSKERIIVRTEGMNQVIMVQLPVEDLVEL